MNPKVTWVVVGLVAVAVLGYLASRVGNIGARSVRDGSAPLTISFSEPIVPGVEVKVTWPTALGEESGPVVVKARADRGEVVVGKGEFGVGQVMIMIPCQVGGEEVGIALYEVTEDGSEQLITQRLTNVLPAGPDCLR